MLFAAKTKKNEESKSDVLKFCVSLLLSTVNFGTSAGTNLKVKKFTCADYTSVMVDGEAVVVVAPADIIYECRTAEGAYSGHMCSNSAVLHYL